LEVSDVQRRLRAAQETARARARQRRQDIAEGERAFDAFLELATPLIRQLANALKVEGHPFTLFTPERALRLASDRTRDDFIELALDTSGDRPEVVGRVSFTRGSRVIDQTMPIEPGAAPDAITEDMLLEFLVTALGPWLER
jgi:hypothetical protein